MRGPTKNFDLKNVVTLINVDRLHQLLKKSNYDREETKFLVDGFTNGFDLGYAGNRNRRDSVRKFTFQKRSGKQTRHVGQNHG